MAAIVIASVVVLASHPDIFFGIYEYVYPKNVPQGSIEIPSVDPVELWEKQRISYSDMNLVFSDSILNGELAYFVGIDGYNVRMNVELPRKSWIAGDTVFFRISMQDDGKNQLKQPYIHILIVDASHIVQGHYPARTFPTFVGKWFWGSISSRDYFLKPSWYAFGTKNDLRITQYGKWYVAALVFDDSASDSKAVASVVADFEILPRVVTTPSTYFGLIGIISSWLAIFLPVRKWWMKLEPILIRAWKYRYMIVPIVIAILYYVFR